MKNVIYTIGAFLLTCAMLNGADYYVAKTGDDLNSGSLSSPFLTIGKAASVMTPGDTCFIRDGVYREEVTVSVSGTSTSPLVFQPYQGEDVVITGLDVVSGWTQHLGGIYKTTVTESVLQLFADGDQMDIARWPDTPSDLLSANNAVVDAVDMNPGTGNPWIEDAALASGNWTGAKVWMLPGAYWGALSSTIVSQSGNRLFLSSNPSINPSLDPDQGTYYYLYDTLEALNSDREFWYDESSDILYFQASGGVDPDTLNSVEIRTRRYGFNLGASNYVEIRGLDFMAATIRVEGSYCVVEECNVLYPTPYFDAEIWKGSPGVELNGSYNTLRFCEIAYSWGDGVTTKNSSSNNVVENNIIHDCNWSAGWSAGINTKGTDHSILRNTIYDTGRSGVRFYNFEGGKLNYNHVFDYGYLTADLGAMKTGNAHTNVTELAYNWVHDEKSIKFGSGIYLDSGTDNYLVHHNVSWKTGNAGLRANREGVNIDFFNNTIADVGAAIGHYNPQGEVYIDVVTKNNISTVSPFLGTDVSNNKVDSAAGFSWVGSSYGDFRLGANSSGEDFGVAIPGITDGYVGLAPDAGAYEFGGDESVSHWLAGITWCPEWNASPLGTFTVSSSDGVLTFDASGSTDPDGSIIRYFWDFGDGTLGGGKSVTHAYQSSGSYTVSLAVNDSLGGSNRVTKTIGILDGQVLSDLNILPNGTKDASSGTLMCGNPGSAGSDQRVFLKFDLPLLEEEWRLLDSWLGLFNVAGIGDTYGQAKLYEVLSPWTEGAVNYSHPIGTDLGMLVTASGPFNQYHGVDITSLMDHHYNGVATNEGFSIRGTEGYGYTAKYFASQEGAPGERPSLEVIYEVPTAFVSTSRVAPQNAEKEFVAASSLGSHGPKKGYVTGGGQTAYQSLGQSFSISSADVGLAIDRLTVRSKSGLNFVDEAGGHTMLIAFMENSDGDGSLETKLGPTFEADFGNRLIQVDDYITFSLDEPIVFSTVGECGFVVYWKEVDSEHIINLERGNGNQYSGGSQVFKDLSSSPDMFPYVANPSGGWDFTFYLD